eukprot:5904681-Pleurochrysis_carterae.AAC.1
MRAQWWEARMATTSGMVESEAWAASMKIGERGRPLSAGCSSTYSAPASRAAVRMATVRRTISLAEASSR